MAMVLLALAGCEPFTLPSAIRCKVMDTGKQTRKCKDSIRDSTKLTASDSCLLLCAAEVPESYDWRRDTACGRAEGRIVLYKNFTPVLSIEAGAQEETSLEPYTHHLLDGRLYTEYAGNAETIIKCDGQTLCRFAGRERLLGLLPLKDGLLSLGAPEEGGGFNLRKDGDMLLSVRNCRVFGGFGELACPRTGALYLDRGHWYFAYCNGDACFLVRDGESKGVGLPQTVSRVLDLRVVGGETLAVGRSGSGCRLFKGKLGTALSSSLNWEGAAILPYDKGIFVAGYGRNSRKEACNIVQDPASGKEWLLAGGLNYPFCSDSGEVWALGIDGRSLTLSAADGALFSKSESLFMDRGCGTVAAGTLYLALSSTADGGKPCLWYGGEMRELDINGYLTAVEVSLAK